MYEVMGNPVVLENCCRLLCLRPTPAPTPARSTVLDLSPPSLSSYPPWGGGGVRPLNWKRLGLRRMFPFDFAPNQKHDKLLFTPTRTAQPTPLPISTNYAASTAVVSRTVVASSARSTPR